MYFPSHAESEEDEELPKKGRTAGKASPEQVSKRKRGHPDEKSETEEHSDSEPEEPKKGRKEVRGYLQYSIHK